MTFIINIHSKTLIRTREHFVMLIEVCMHLIECHPRHPSSYALSPTFLTMLSEIQNQSKINAG